MKNITHETEWALRRSSFAERPNKYKTRWTGFYRARSLRMKRRRSNRRENFPLLEKLRSGKRAVGVGTWQITDKIEYSESQAAFAIKL